MYVVTKDYVKLAVGVLCSSRKDLCNFHLVFFPGLGTVAYLEEALRYHCQYYYYYYFHRVFVMTFESIRKSSS